MTLKPEDVALIERVKSLCNDWANGENLVITGNVIEDVEDVIELAEHPDPRPSPVGREEVARLIDPDPWGSHDSLLLQADEPGRAPETAQRWRTVASNLVAPSLAKADAILALFSPADGWRDV